MDYAAIRKRVIRRMAEYRAGAPEAAATASISGQTIYDEIIEQYRAMVDEIAAVDPEKVTVFEPLTYPADTEAEDLPDPVQHRRIRSVELLLRQSSPAIYVPLGRMTLEQQADSILSGEGQDEAVGWSGYGFRTERDEVISLIPQPRRAETLRIRYVAAIDDIEDDTDDDEIPTLLPVEFHALLALRTACAFLNETGATPQTLVAELDRGQVRFVEWMRIGPKDGPRYVRSTGY